jgi:propionyl-CoA carboxylase beta chain
VDFAQLRSKRKEHQVGGGKEKQEEQRKKKKLTAFERMNLLFDSESFVEIDEFVLHECTDFGMEKKRILGDGVVTGYGMIDSRLAYSFSHDFSVLGGSLGLAFASKVCKIMDLALKHGVPIIGINTTLEEPAYKRGSLALQAMLRFFIEMSKHLVSFPKYL